MDISTSTNVIIDRHHTVMNNIDEIDDNNPNKHSSNEVKCFI